MARLKKFNINSVFLAAILLVLAYFIYSVVQPPVKYTEREYIAAPLSICPGESITWISGIEMKAPRQPMDMTTARDLWNETNNQSVPGMYRNRPFILPHTVSITTTEVFSDTANLAPADYILSDTTGGRLTARDGYIVRFTIRAC